MVIIIISEFLSLLFSCSSLYCWIFNCSKLQILHRRNRTLVSAQVLFTLKCTITMFNLMFTSPISSCRAQSWPFYFGLIVPFGLIYIFNVAIFIIIISSMIRRTNLQKNIANGDKHKKLKENFWITVGLTILLGVSWVFGMLATAGLPNYIRIPFDIVFTVLASLQGVFVFLFYCVRCPECRQLWKNWILCRFTKKSQLRGSTTVSQPTNSTSNTSTGTLQRLTDMAATLNLKLSNKQTGGNDSTLPPTDTTTSGIQPALEVEHRGGSGYFKDDYTERITFYEEPSNEGKLLANEDEDI